jgi:hypothetical protein
MKKIIEIREKYFLFTAFNLLNVAPSNFRGGPSTFNPSGAEAFSSLQHEARSS